MTLEQLHLMAKPSNNFLPKKVIHCILLLLFSPEIRVNLEQESVSVKKNEILVMPKLLDLIYVKNSIIMIDAMGCQTEIAKKIIDQEADYILHMENNKKTLL